MELTNSFKEIEALAKRINASVEDKEEGWPDWDTCFPMGKDDEDAWAEIEMDNAIMERESNYV